jgi:mannan endo-1,4-beta-mannosidase
MDGGWFWWSDGGEAAIKSAYDTLYNRLTNYHGLNNIIWVWGLNYADAAWTPNDMGKIDIATWDRYGEPFDYADPSWDIDTLRATFPNTLIALGEVGSYPDPLQSWEHDKMYSFFVGWNEYAGLRSNSSAHIDYVFNSEYVLDASEAGYFPPPVTGKTAYGRGGIFRVRNGKLIAK